MADNVSEKEKLWVSTVFRGMMRNSKWMGVPVDGFMLNAMISILIFINVNPLIGIFVVFPVIHVFMYFLTRYDPDYFEILVKMGHYFNVKNKQITGADTYVP